MPEVFHNVSVLGTHSALLQISFDNASSLFLAPLFSHSLQD